MSSLSASALALTGALFEETSLGAKNKVTYEVNIADTRDSTTVTSMTFKLNNPITEADLVSASDNLFKKVSSELAANAATLLGSSLIYKHGLSDEVVQKPPKIKGIVDIRLGAPEDAVTGLTVAARTVKGRLISQNNLQNMLELLMKENMLMEMTTGNAGGGLNTPLRNRTGRFVTSAQVDRISISNEPGSKVQSMSIYYRYMIYPYQVFDPHNTKSPQMGLASSARNPQRIIGNALARAARTLLGSNYKLSIRQAN